MELQAPYQQREGDGPTRLWLAVWQLMDVPSPAGVGADLPCGHEDNWKKRCEVFTLETLKEQLGYISWAKVFDDLDLEM